MAFGAGQLVTSRGKAMIVGRLMGGGAPAQAEPRYAAIGVGATGAARTAAVGDTTLSTEVEARSGTNVGTAATTTVAGDTYQVTQTIAITAPRNVDEAGLFDAAAAGNMFASATFPALPLGAGDTLALTWQIQLT